MACCKRPWPVLFLSCLVLFSCLGSTFAMGAIFTDIMDKFGVSRATASLVQSVSIGFTMMSGIMVAPLVHWKGPRPVIMGGSLLATAGCVIAFLATHITQVIVGLGVISGIGLSGGFVAAQATAGVVFHDSRSLAMTAITSSSAFGTAAFPQVYRHMTKLYTLRGTFLIMAAINCQLILCGMLIGFLVSWPPQVISAKPKTLEIPVEDSRPREQHPTLYVAQDQDGERLVSPTKDSAGEKRQEESEVAADSIEQENAANAEDKLLGLQTRLAAGGGGEKTEDVEGHTSNGKKLPGTSSRRSVRTKTARHGVAARFQLHIFRNVCFVCFSLLGPMCMFLFIQPMVFMTDIVKSNGMTVKEGSFILSVMFLGNVIGRISAGVFYKLLRSNIIFIPCVAMMTGGVACLFFSFASEYVHFLAVSFVMGLGFGEMISTTVMSLLEILGPRGFITGNSFHGFVSGFVIVVSGPFGGLVRDMTNSYQSLFYIGAVQGLTTGAVLVIIVLRHLNRS